MKRNLLEVCLSPDLGGLELYMMRCAKALEEDFNVTSLIDSKGRLLEYFVNTPSDYVLMHKSSNLLMFGTALKLARLIDEKAIDIVHFHWTKDMPLVVLAKKLSTKKPKLVQTRNMLMTRFKDDFYHRFLYRNLHLMLPTSQEVKDQIEKFVPLSVRPRVEVVYMGADAHTLMDEEETQQLRSELGMDGAFSVGMVGRIEHTKGQYLLIDAIASLRAKGVEIKAFFVGHPMVDGYLDELKNMIRRHNLEDAVYFLGFMKSPHHFMQACDALVLATEHETFGLVLIEAMQMGTVVVGSDRGGPLEIIEHGLSGLHFKSGSSESLAEQLEFLTTHPNDSALMAENGQKRAREMFLNTVQFKKLSDILSLL